MHFAEPDVDISGINARVAFEIQCGMTAYIAWQRAWSPTLIDALLAAAEQLASQRGYSPPSEPS
jgi:hypothetical protein